MSTALEPSSCQETLPELQPIRAAGRAPHVAAKYKSELPAGAEAALAEIVELAASYGTDDSAFAAAVGDDDDDGYDEDSEVGGGTTQQRAEKAAEVFEGLDRQAEAKWRQHRLQVSVSKVVSSARLSGMLSKAKTADGDGDAAAPPVDGGDTSRRSSATHAVAAAAAVAAAGDAAPKPTPKPRPPAVAVAAPSPADAAEAPPPSLRATLRRHLIDDPSPEMRRLTEGLTTALANALKRAEGAAREHAPYVQALALPPGSTGEAAPPWTARLLDVGCIRVDATELWPQEGAEQRALKPLFAHMTLEQLTAGGGRSVSTMRWKTAGLTARLGLRVAAPAADPPKDPEAMAKRRDGAKMFRLKSVGADHV